MTKPVVFCYWSWICSCHVSCFASFLRAWLHHHHHHQPDFSYVAALRLIKMTITWSSPSTSRPHYTLHTICLSVLSDWSDNREHQKLLSIAWVFTDRVYCCVIQCENHGVAQTAGLQKTTTYQVIQAQSGLQIRYSFLQHCFLDCVKFAHMKWVNTRQLQYGSRFRLCALQLHFCLFYRMPCSECRRLYCYRCGFMFGWLNSWSDRDATWRGGWSVPATLCQMGCILPKLVILCPLCFSCHGQNWR